jgi:sugar transferase EpsL
VKSWQVKRLFDLGVSCVALLVLWPVMLVVAVLVRFRLGSPVLFRQQRPGLHGKPFEIIKFRTMTDETDASGQLRSDAERLTSFGKFLRSTSLDELPEFFNVIRGEMSLVGPRPLLMQYLELYTPEQHRRHDVRPGITGLSQISGRNDQTWADRLALDVHYVDTHTIRMDLGIMLSTLRSVVKREGVAAEGHATMPALVGDPGRAESSFGR